MSYDEFYTKLQTIKVGYKKLHGRDLISLEDLEKYLDSQLTVRKSKGAKSLRGLKL
jgi:hypothetical protein